ncbi:MAG: hypothetical protein Kow00121_32420 [Elainellaceae cyanobacterium]
MTTDDNQELAKDYFRVGQATFERGRYRESVEALEKAVELSGAYSQLGGEIQIWLVNAYQAAERHDEAIALCEQLGNHPHWKTRKQSRRLLYILKAPQLKARPEWLTQIPDLSNLEEGTEQSQAASRYVATTPRSPRPKSQPEPEPIDLSQVNTKDNGFIWVALVAIALTIGGLIWFS